MARRRRPKEERVEEVEVVEEEIREERKKRKSLERRLNEAVVALIGREAAQHLINAKIEIFKAFRAMIDERIKCAEKASEKLQEIEVR